MIYGKILSGSQIIVWNPIVRESWDLRKMYFDYLKKCIHIGKWRNRKFVRAQIKVYSSVLCGDMENDTKHCAYSKKRLKKYRFYLFFDLIAILGYEYASAMSDSMNRVKEHIYRDFLMPEEEINFVANIIKVLSVDSAWELIEESPFFKKYYKYIELVKNNRHFIEQKPYRVMVTATMSAGKSTFINALTGKQTCLSQNMACTSKIHSVIGKAYEDGYSCEYDHDLVLNAGKDELMENNEANESNKILVSTYYNGILGGKRIIVSDSPGVNFSRDMEHKEITNKMVRAKKYDMLIYLMNATQLGTNDDEEHLQYVRKYIGRTPVIFVINKIDMFNSEDENVEDAIYRQIKYLQSQGFKKPIVCPVSSQAGYLAKKSQGNNLNRLENRELGIFIDKFEDTNFTDFYKKYYPEISVNNSKKEEIQLLKNCGIVYVEEIIKLYYEGGKINGTSLCKV